MPDESEVIHADVYVEFPLPNGGHLRGKPVAYPEARKILAAFHAFDSTNDYDGILVPALDRFSELTGLTDAQIMAADPGMTLGDLCSAIQRFFFLRRPSANGAAAKPSAPAPGA